MTNVVTNYFIAVHRPGTEIITPDYLSRFGVSLCFDELSQNYLNRTINFCRLYPPASGTMLPENMPGYRAPCVHSIMPPEPTPTTALYIAPAATPYVDPTFAPILSSIYMEIRVAITSVFTLFPSSLAT